MFWSMTLKGMWILLKGFSINLCKNTAWSVFSFPHSLWELMWEIYSTLHLWDRAKSIFVAVQLRASDGWVWNTCNTCSFLTFARCSRLWYHLPYLWDFIGWNFYIFKHFQILYRTTKLSGQNFCVWFQRNKFESTIHLPFISTPKNTLVYCFDWIQHFQTETFHPPAETKV